MAANVDIIVRTSGAREAEDALKGISVVGLQVSSSLKAIFETATGVALATSFAGIAAQVTGLAKELVTLGLETKRQEEAFARMTESLGVNGQALARELENASRGIADVSDNMTTAVRGLQEGLAPEQLVNLMKIATAQSQLMGTTVTESFNSITTAMINQQERGLKSAGIAIDVQAAYIKMADALGIAVKDLSELDKVQAIYNETAEKTKGSVAALSQEQLTAAQNAEKAATAWQNFKEDLAVGLVDALGKTVLGFQDAAAATTTFAENLFNSRDAFYANVAGAADYVTSIVTLGAAYADTNTETDEHIRAVRDAELAWKDGEVTVVGLGDKVLDLGTNAAAAAEKMRTMGSSLATIFRSLEEELRKASMDPLAKATDDILDKFRKFPPEIVKALEPWAASMAKAKHETDESAKALKNAEAEAKKHAAAMEAGAKAAEGFERALQGMIDPADEIGRKLADIDAKAAAAAKQFPEFAARILDAAEKTKQLVIEFDRLAKEWDKIKDTPSHMAEAFNDFDAAMLKSTNMTEKVVAGLAGIVAAGDPFRYSLSENSKVVFTFGDAFGFLEPKLQKVPALFTTITPELEAMAHAAEASANSVKLFGLAAGILNDDVTEISLGLSNITPALERMTKSAGDAALEMAILNDKMAPVLEKAESDTWADFGKGIEEGFLSVTDTMTKMVNGLIAGTLDIGEAFANLGQSLIANFVQVVIHQVFDPILSAAADFVTQLLRSLTGGGGTPTLNLSGTVLGGLFGGATDINTPGMGPPGMFGPFNTGGAGGGGAMNILNMGWSAISGGAGLTQSFPAINSAITAFNAARDAGMGFFEAIGSGWESFAATASVGTMGTIVAGLGAAFTLYQGINALASGQTGAGIGTLAGMGLGAAGGALAGNFIFPGIGALAGGLIGAGLGGQIGGLIGGLFGVEDWEQIHQLRAQQRTRTGEALQGQVLDELFGATSTQGLISTFQQGAGGTGVSIGDVLLRMAQTYSGTQIGDLGQFQLDEPMRDRIMDFLQAGGFTGGEFAQGRVGSIQELIAASGIEDWEDIMAGLNAFIAGMTEMEEGVGGLKKAAADVAGLSLDQAHEQAVVFFETLRLADTFSEGGFEQAGQAVREQLMAIAEGVNGGVEAIREVATQAIMADPLKLLRVTGVEQWQREGEKIEDTAARVATALMALGQMTDGLDAEVNALLGVFDAEAWGETFSGLTDEINTQMDKLASAVDPTDMAAAASAARAAMIARYEAEMALVAIISEGTTAIYSAGVAIGQLAPLVNAIGVDFGALATGAAFVAGNLPTVESKLIGLGGAVDMFGSQVNFALATMDPAKMGGAFDTFKTFLASFTSAAASIALIEDPAQRLAAWTTLFQQAGAAIDIFIGLISGMINAINQLAGNIAAAGDAIAQNAGWLAQAGIDIASFSNQMAGLIDIFPTIGAKLSLLGSSIQLFLAGIDVGQIKPGSTTFMTQLQPILEGFYNTFMAAIQLINPAERLAALTGIMNSIGTLLAGLPPDVASALVSAFGPEIQILVGAIITATEEQARQAAAIAEELTEIIGDKALSPENFLLMMVSGINSSLNIIIQGAKPLFDLIVTGMETAGKDIANAITTAGTALSTALGNFATPAAQLASALTGLAAGIAGAVSGAISSALDGIELQVEPVTVTLEPVTVNVVVTEQAAQTAQSGRHLVPDDALYRLHKGEIVVNPWESEAIRAGEGVYGSQGYEAFGATQEYRGGTTVVTLHFGDIHLAEGGRKGAEDFLSHVEQEIQTGRLRGAVQRAARGLV